MAARHLYIHVPFCARRCAYCDFSIAVRPEVPVDDFVDGIRRELSLHRTKSDVPLDTLYLGGGTPSRLGGRGIAMVLETIAGFAGLAPNAEVTMEVNPEDVTADTASAWISAGINRFSLGAQTFDDAVLEWMHRVHDSAQSLRAFEILRAAGAGNISLDLIFALPDALSRNWRADLEQVVSLQPEHVSLYGLTVETGTPLQRWVDRGATFIVPDDRYSEEFLEAHEILGSDGFEHYEVSNFARPGSLSRHNSAYWSGAEYEAIGPSAHRFNGAEREWNLRHYAGWLQALRNDASPVHGREQLTDEMKSIEKIYLGLRTTNGLSLGDVSDIASVRAWQSAGWAEIDESTVRLTAEGWLRLDALAFDLTLSRSNF